MKTSLIAAAALAGVAMAACAPAVAQNRPAAQQSSADGLDARRQQQTQGVERIENHPNLNGIWQYQSASSLNDSQYPPFGQDLAQEVLIPSCLESGLSG